MTLRTAVVCCISGLLVLAMPLHVLCGHGHEAEHQHHPGVQSKSGVDHHHDQPGPHTFSAGDHDIVARRAPTRLPAIVADEPAVAVPTPMTVASVWRTPPGVLAAVCLRGLRPARAPPAL